MNWPLLVAGYLLIGLALTAWFVRQDPANHPRDRHDWLVLGSYVLLWPVVVVLMLLDVLSRALFP